MRLRFLIGAIALGLALSACAAGDQALLPKDGFAKGWVIEGSPRVFEGEALYDHIDGGAENFLELGFETCTVQDYRGQGEEITLEIYRMRDAAAALGIYLVQCGKERPDARLSERHTLNTNQILLTKGRYYLVATSPKASDAIVPVLVAMGASVSSGLPPDAPPEVLQLLPREGLLPGSLRIIRGPTGLQALLTLGEGDVLQLGGAVTAVAGDFKQAGGERVTRLVAQYPSAEAAKDALKHLKANLDPLLKVQSSTDDGFVFLDYKGRFGKCDRDGMRLNVVAGLSAKPPGGASSPAP